jgi:glyoxylase-like metal-dependent hydrolase (beta-lactamase superfamily II)
MTLPPPTKDQAYCKVSALEAGLIELPLAIFLTEADPATGEKDLAPSLSFLLHHSNNNKKFIFDLGIRKDLENYPPATRECIKTVFPCHVTEDPVDSLAKGGYGPDDIDYICLSHVHFDHVGDPSLFPKSTFLVGAESKDLLTPGYPADPNSEYASDLLPFDRTQFLDTTKWPPLGPFPHALDFYGDGSLYIIDAAGHEAGHVNLVARTSPDGAWILLGGVSLRLPR